MSVLAAVSVASATRRARDRLSSPAVSAAKGCRPDLWERRYGVQSLPRPAVGAPPHKTAAAHPAIVKM